MMKRAIGVLFACALTGLATAATVPLLEVDLNPTDLRRSGTLNNQADTSVTSLPSSVQEHLLFYASLGSTPTVDSSKGSGSWTFSRNSVATYKNSANALAVAPVDEARFSPDGYGVLIEDTETNEVTYSEELENAAWTETTATVYENASISFYAASATIMDHVRETTDDALHVIHQEYTGVASKTDVLSVYAKTDGTRTIAHVDFWDYDGAVIQQFYDLDAGTVLSASVTGGGGSGASIAGAWIDGPYSDGSYRLILAVNAQENTSRAIEFGPALEDLKGAYAGNASYGIYFAGAMVEKSVNSTAKYATSYIKTTNAAATREKDVLTYAASYNLPNTAPGTIVADVTQANPTKCTVLSTTNDSNQQGMWMYVNNTLVAKGLVTTTTDTVDVDGTGQVAANTPKTLALAWSLNDSVLYEGSTEVATDTSCAMPTSHTRIRLSNGFGGGAWVRRI